MTIKPSTTLTEGLLMRIYFGDLLGVRTGGNHQVMVNAQFHFTADSKGGIQKIIEGMADDTFSGVFNRHHTVIAVFRRHLAKHVINGDHWHTHYRMTELFKGR